METQQPEVPEQVRRTARAEASAWLVRLHGPHRNAGLEAGFRAWLSAHPENAKQFERVSEVWEVGATPVQVFHVWLRTRKSHRIVVG